MITNDQIKYMVNRFLGWKLPENFRPDAGISFKATFNENTAHPSRHEPLGTNLFDAQQADAMVLHMVEGMPAGADDQLYEALKWARRTIKALHGKIAWDIYERSSPEMKAIDAALARAEGRTP